MDAGLGAMEDDARVQNYVMAVLEVNRREGARPYHEEVGMARGEPGGALSAMLS